MLATEPARPGGSALLVGACLASAPIHRRQPRCLEAFTLPRPRLPLNHALQMCCRVALQQRSPASCRCARRVVRPTRQSACADIETSAKQSMLKQNKALMRRLAGKTRRPWCSVLSVAVPGGPQPCCPARLRRARRSIGTALCQSHRVAVQRALSNAVLGIWTAPPFPGWQGTSSGGCLFVSLVSKP